ncbi:hypothetical protein [Noviluteimonas gilva]|uniref:Spore coat protein U domain-containing protein n=1 Tax=Noviluteimonas gilva TaxID=2682097 RepID=A0A7C9M1S2_9GAMM|nr:hypothetical protein [Lysobacter gilvus]MUV14548.1 hypothetical protein [Lysobacter gilvus]
MKATHALTAILLVAAVLSAPAKAARVEEPGSTACVGNTAQDDNALRKRTSGATNESTTSVVITCSVPIVSLMIPPNDSTNVVRVRLALFNGATASRNIGCRLVRFNNGPGGPDPVIANVTVPRNGRAVMDIRPDQDRHGQTSFALTCTIPPLMTIERLTLDTRDFQWMPME